MGDMADWINENGEEQWLKHLSGECGDDWCQYCHNELSDEE